MRATERLHTISTGVRIGSFANQTGVPLRQRGGDFRFHDAIVPRGLARALTDPRIS
jgi:hypothetical protein